GMLARLIGAMFGFPRAGKQIPVLVRFAVSDGRETWRRTFGGRSFASVQEAGRGRSEWLLSERFGPFRFGVALVMEEQRLRLVVRNWSVLGVPLPRSWSPQRDAFEFVDDGKFGFDVTIGQKLTGLIVRYRGWLVPCHG